MKREELLEGALRAMLRAGRDAVVAEERKNYWDRFGTQSRPARNADVRHARAIAALERAEAMAAAALRGNVTDYQTAAAIVLPSTVLERAKRY